MQKRAIAALNLKALAHNLAQVKALAPACQVLAMVKANAYGHGLLPVAQHLPQTDYLGVATLEEAVLLRQAGLTKPVALMSGFHSLAELELLAFYKVQPVIYDWYQIKMLADYVGDYRFSVWLKVDTGMHRLGFPLMEGRTAYTALKECKTVAQVTVMTHFACADDQDRSFTEKQIQVFNKIAEGLAGAKSAANSAGLIYYPESHYDIVRPGLMLYGIMPGQLKESAPIHLIPAMQLTAKILSIKSVGAGESVGYGATWIAQRQSRIATVSIGYGDGYPQTAPSGTPVLIAGKRVPTVGRVSMDTLTVDVTDLSFVAVGDEVILWGEHLPVEEVAKHLNLSPYALLTGVTARVLRECVEENVLSLTQQKTA